MTFKRILLFCVVGFALGVEAAAEAPVPGQSDIARRGGVYTSLSVRDPAACASACAADGLCLAWTYLPSNACELTAIASAPVVLPGARSGLSNRAPDFARRISYAPEPVALDPNPAAARPAHPNHPAAPNANDPGDELLGGPLNSAENDLRLRLGDGVR